MPQERLSNDEFFTKLSDLLVSKKDHGSVFLTQKRLSYDPSNPPPTKTLTRPSKVTKPTLTKKKPSSSSSSTFTKTIHPQPTEADLKTDLLSLLSESTASTSTASAEEETSETTAPVPILIRATNGKSNDPRHNGKHVKLSTVVETDQLEAFFTRYAEVCKQGLTGLKKKVRKNKKNKKTKKK
ncbi:hypothetical protein TWF569_009458 [Orbilia oligospora]|uniref:Signal recognition particle subunit SRP14 n=1 Tax=Orbilia oligospora TaxID=2813651 RepID=A0A7C8NN59_ORBOL|nr:hypothetical protein TWF103_002262 [Orbilia oligospora]KAF3092680.1 hypothetical protein TWF706_008982 [Orbilia oligospora]KAF3109136.1 hypothetical protein TWF102_009913 [Orbilia oligospora]KAF3127107.1 hypothetical protein TWF703_010055 [Orbilia oligospora]KAF3136466.1 hypothetical protein TWF569_009458 [Orbilia oligospora]